MELWLPHHRTEHIGGRIQISLRREETHNTSVVAFARDLYSASLLVLFPNYLLLWLTYAFTLFYHVVNFSWMHMDCWLLPYYVNRMGILLFVFSGIIISHPFYKVTRWGIFESRVYVSLREKFLYNLFLVL